MKASMAVKHATTALVEYMANAEASHEEISAFLDGYGARVEQEEIVEESKGRAKEITIPKGGPVFFDDAAKPKTMCQRGPDKPVEEDAAGDYQALEMICGAKILRWEASKHIRDCQACRDKWTELGDIPGKVLE